MTGVGRYLTGLVPALAKIFKEDEFVIIGRSGEEKTWSLLPENAHVILVNIPTGGISQHVLLNRIVSKLNVDLFHYPMFDLPVYIKSPSVITVHDLNAICFPDYFTKGKWWRKPAARLLHISAIKRARMIITPSQAAADDLCGLFPAARGKVAAVTHGYTRINTDHEQACYEDMRSKSSLPSEYVLYVGVHRPHKNLEGLIKAVDKLRNTGNPISLVAAGAIDDRFMGPRKLAERLGMGSVVKFTGHVSDSELAVLYENAKCMVFASFQEGFGLPLLEAMDYGVPIACSDIPVHREVAKDAALYFDPGSPDDMAGAIRLLLDDRKLGEKLVEAGRKRLESFKWEDSAKKTMEVYRQAVEMT